MTTPAAPWCLIAPPPPPIAGDLVEALVARLSAAMVAPGLLSWAGTGRSPGFREAALPFALIGTLDEEADYQEDGSGHAPFDDVGSVPLLVFAGTEAAARALSRAISAALTDAPLVFADGDLLMIRRTARGSPVLDVDPAAGGKGCWTAHLMFATITAKNL